MINKFGAIVCLLLINTAIFGNDKDPHRRLRHLHEAAENLQAAGLEDEAHKIREHAEQLESELNRGNRHHPEQVHEEVFHQLHEIHQAMKGLQNEIRELHKQIETLKQSRSENRPLLNFPEQIGKTNVFRFIPGPNGPRFEPVLDAWDLNMPSDTRREILRDGVKSERKQVPEKRVIPVPLRQKQDVPSPRDKKN